jgi:hypothetical protein
MLIIVSRNPAQTCSVSAVPTCVRGLNSLTSAENCAESATTENPHTIASANSHQGAAPKTKPDTAAHTPLTSMAAPATRALPHVSAQNPAIAHPAAPVPMATNATSEPVCAVTIPAALNEAAANAAIHVHMA